MCENSCCCDRPATPGNGVPGKRSIKKSQGCQGTKEEHRRCDKKPADGTVSKG